MDSLKVYFPLLQSTWDNYPKLLTLSAVSGVAFSIFAFVKIANSPIVFTISLNPIALVVGISMIASLAYFVFFKGKVEEAQEKYIPTPKWLEDDFYELDSLVDGKVELSGLSWMRYSYYSLYFYQLGMQGYQQASVVFNELKKASDEGHSQGKFKLSYCYEKGIGCKRDLNKAFELLKEAEISHNKDVLVKLGLYYLNVENNPKKAVELWEIAAEGERGHPFAKYLVANYHEKNFKSNPSPELAKKIITYHKQVVEHPSRMGWSSELRLNHYYTDIIMAVNGRIYKDICTEMCDLKNFNVLLDSHIRCIILIWGAGLRGASDAAFNEAIFLSEMRQEMSKYEGGVDLVQQYSDLRSRLRLNRTL